MSEISQQAGFHLTTAHRILNALKYRGYVQQNPDNSKYALTLKLFELGNKVIRSVDLRKETLPVLRELVNRTGETAYLLVLDGAEAICLERIDGDQFVKFLILKVGGRLPLHMGGGPKVLFAYQSEESIERIIKTKGLPAWTGETIIDPTILEEKLKEIRQQGYAVGFGDISEEGASIGCPVQNHKGEVVAAISISGLSDHFRGNNLPSLIEAVRDAATELSHRLGTSLLTACRTLGT